MGIVIAIVIGLIILSIIVIPLLFADVKKEQNRAIEMLRSVGLEELQKPYRVPQLYPLMVDLTETTLFKMNATIWFEALLAETFARPRNFSSDLTFLTSQYVRFLTTIGDYISKWWPDAFVETRDRDEIVAVTVEGGEVWNLLVLHKSLEWLQRVATEQNCLAEVRDAGIIKWETALFKSTFEERSVQGGIRTHVQGSISFRLTPGALKGEIARLSLLQS